MRALTESEFNDWINHPVTVAVKRILANRRDQMRRDWEGGSFTDYDAQAMALTNVGNIGTCKGYAFVMDLDYTAYIGELDEESIGAGTQGSGGAD